MALLLKRDLREGQAIHHLTEQRESNPQFWGSMLRFSFNKALISSLHENANV